MPFNGPEWLSMTDEPPLEPQIPICDAHQHFWDFRTKLKPYDRYLIHELADDLSCGHNVRSTVFIEARSMYRADGPEELRPVVKWSLSRVSPRPAQAAFTGQPGSRRQSSGMPI